MRPIRTYSISVRGFNDTLWSARSPAKARAECWRAFSSYDGGLATFGDFLRMSRIRRVPDPPGIGERILVCGLPATRVIGGVANYVAFMRDDSDVILMSHPADVGPLLAEAA